MLARGWGEPSTLEYADVPMPRPQAGEVVIDVRAIGCAFPDILLVRGTYQHRPQFPFIPGFEVGSGYHSAQPEPQGRRGQQRQNQPRGQQRQNQPHGQQRQKQQQPKRFPSSHEEGWRGAPGRSRDQARGGRPQRQPAPIMPSEKAQQSVRQEQLEYHRHQQQAEEHRTQAKPANERAKEKAVPALFGVVGRKVA